MRYAAPARLVAVVLALVLTGPVLGQSRNLAPGFTSLPNGAKVVIMPTDIEVFSISAGGVLEPKADWTESASKNFKAALMDKQKSFGLLTVELSAQQAEEADEVNALHGAVARAIAVHHFGPLSLPTKDGKLDWSMGDPVQIIKKMTGADYALFTWIRDSHASEERKAAMVAIAILSLGRAIPGGGRQIGYASLVDLNSGRVMWFNNLNRNAGDLVQAENASETIDVLLREFPRTK
jgi:hypothetical protein